MRSGGSCRARPARRAPARSRPSSGSSRSTFFGLESPGLSLAVIAALLAAILATIGLFRPLDRVAAWLLAPYAAWVAYAAAVNLGVLILN